MESEAHRRPPRLTTNAGITSTSTDTAAPGSVSLSSTITSYSPSALRRDVQECFKRHRPFNTRRATFRPIRMIAPQQGSGISDSSDDSKIEDGKLGANFTAWRKDMVSMINKAKETSITPPSTLVGKTSSHSGGSCDQPSYAHKECVMGVTHDISLYPSHGDNQPLEADDNKPIMACSMDENASHGVHAVMTTGLSSLPTHEGSLASVDLKITETNQVEVLTAISQNVNQGMVSSITDKRAAGINDPSYEFGTFLNHPTTRLSVVGSSCTTTMGNSSSAPMITSTTRCSCINQGDNSHANDCSNVNSHRVGCGDALQPPHTSCKQISANEEVLSTSNAYGTEALDSKKGSSLIYDQLERGGISKNKCGVEKSVRWKEKSADVTDIQSQAPLSKTSTTELSLKSEKPENSATEKGPSAPRKKNSNLDAFFKVNGKLYQKLGKIGSGGSSEVHKVISSDCNIYALKKIRLKGRDYATAFGFCQEILYLNKLKGKSYIIQLIDFEVTDKSLLQEVMIGSMSNKDSKVKDDGYIFMVLEYGEIDLAHMLSQQWKEITGCDQTIDYNWLRFYWQQILLAVNTIHEERIVHSDLKPANFLLVRGSLKLIDFGIAKAIMNDTTNIQRDSQVGTLSYMSPEAFMCNETDADGNIIKCGRSSDIWSLGCILYQMVYGRTPFAEHKTFWTKFKVITDPNHEIKYPPLSNQWLLDLMKKCLVWDRHKRWRIPQLLEHPFLRPPITSIPSSLCSSQTCKLVQLISEGCGTDQEALTLRQHLIQLLDLPVKPSLHIEEVLSTPNAQCYSFTFRGGSPTNW